MTSTFLPAAFDEDSFEQAAGFLSTAVSSGQVRAASIFAREKQTTFSRAFGEANSIDASFLLGSISKPISVAALMTFYDQGEFDLQDTVKSFIPQFRGGGKDQVTIQHLLTHVSGLPDQLPNNAELRASHAPLSEFVEGAIACPLAFVPGTQYEYSSMAIMLAAEIAQLISGQDIRILVKQRVLKPLGMQHSALGIANLNPAEIMPAQVEHGAVESGGGTEESRQWDWNSSYWRQLGAPWGGAHASAPDVARFLAEFLQPQGKLFRPEVAQLMVRNHNRPRLNSRGLGFDLGLGDYCTACSEQAFGHSGSTGTLAWADPQLDRACVVLTTLPARALATQKHPRQLASNRLAGIT